MLYKNLCIHTSYYIKYPTHIPYYFILFKVGRIFKVPFIDKNKYVLYNNIKASSVFGIQRFVY